MRISIGVGESKLTTRTSHVRQVASKASDRWNCSTLSSLVEESDTLVNEYPTKRVNLLVDVSPNISLAVLMIAWTSKLVGVPGKVYIQCGYDKHGP